MEKHLSSMLSDLLFSSDIRNTPICNNNTGDNNLSGGEMKRLSLASTLCKSSPVLILNDYLVYIIIDYNKYLQFYIIYFLSRMV